MKRLLFVLPLLVLGLVSCSKHNEPSPPCDGGVCPLPSVSETVPPVSTAPPVQVLAQENWSVSVQPGWEPMESPLQDSHIRVFVGNKEKQNLVVFVKEPFAGTNAEYILEGIRGLKDGGYKIAGARQVDINGNKFVLVDSSQGNVRIWMWIVAKDGFGYALSCGGPTVDTSQEDMCTSVANTLTIK